MSIWGKLAGASAGFVLGGPLGALLGALAGHLYDRWQERPSPAQLEQERAVWTDATEARRLAFVTALVALAAKLAKSDGVVTRVEIDAFKRAFDLQGEDRKRVAELYNEAKNSPHGFEEYATQLAEIVGYDHALLEELLDGLFAIAAADGRFHPAEEEFLARVARIFGFTSEAFEAVKARWRALRAPAEERPDPYAVLGLTRQASDAEIRETYRRLVREYHPDRLIALGLPEEFVKLANEKLAAINAAYEQIARERNLR